MKVTYEDDAVKFTLKRYGLYNKRNATSLLNNFRHKLAHFAQPNGSIGSLFSATEKNSLDYFVAIDRIKATTQKAFQIYRSNTNVDRVLTIELFQKEINIIMNKLIEDINSTEISDDDIERVSQFVSNEYSA